jgi:hypothetical protein
MSKLQSNDILNISCIIEDDESEYLQGVRAGKKFVRDALKANKNFSRARTGLGTLIGGGIGYYLGKKLLNNNNAAQSLHDELADNEDTHSLHDKIVNMFKHHES